MREVAQDMKKAARETRQPFCLSLQEALPAWDG
jgi:hypothetical protein